jgi:hypothetical protein
LGPAVIGFVLVISAAGQSYSNADANELCDSEIEDEIVRGEKTYAPLMNRRVRGTSSSASL